LDRFGEINNIFGYENGDFIIRELAQRLGGVFGEPERVARLRGGEFGVLLSGSDVVLVWHIGDKILGLPIGLKRFHEKMGPYRYAVFVILLLSMVALPIKMVLRWLFNLKYIIAMPEIFFNI
jgi:GGDEF domain-containing protein